MPMSPITSTWLNPGAAVVQAGELAAGAASLGWAATTGAAGLALTGAVAARQTGSGRYAAGAMLGQFRPIAKVGEIAAAMGETGELVSSAIAGGRSQRSGVRALAALAASDSRRTDAAGLTFRDYALERRMARTVLHRPTIIEEVGAAARGFQAGVLTTAVIDRSRQLGTAVSDRVGRVSDAWQRFSDEVETQHGGAPNPLTHFAAGAITLDRHVSRRGQAMHLNPDTRQVVWSPRVAPTDLPADTLREPSMRVRVPRLLTLGYHIQQNDDGTISAWQPAGGPAASGRSPSRPASSRPEDPQIAALSRRIALIEAGGLIGDLAALRAERTRLMEAPPVSTPTPQDKETSTASTPTPKEMESATSPVPTPKDEETPPASALTPKDEEPRP